MGEITEGYFNIPECQKFGSMLDIAERGLAVETSVGECFLDCLFVIFENESWMIAKLAKVLKRLEDVLMRR